MPNAGQAMSVLHADFTGTTTNMFEVTQTPGSSWKEVLVSIRDQGSNADGVYYLQHLDYTTPASPAWVNLVSSADAITAVASNAVCKVFDKLPPGLYRLNTASETGTVDIFIYGESINLDNLTDPTA